MKSLLLIRSVALLLLILSFQGKTQTAPFQVALEPFSISGLGGLQSFAWGQSNGKWLIVGGRLDGLHRRQPFAAFDVAGHNTQLIVVDPVNKQKWSAPLSSLPVGIQEQLSSTNMEFYQEGDYLYVAGGYGYSASLADHVTYAKLSAIKVPDVINAIITGTTFSTFFRQISDTLFAVTGGYLNKINATYYLTGGQKFMGRYNPMGPSSGPGFVQVYTNAIRKFKINDNGSTLTVTHLGSFTDVTNLHRRDYNVIPQILPTGEQGLTAFSGVFQTGVDLPFLNCVNIDSVSYVVNNNFSQYYNHYHCAHIPLYSSNQNEMHNLFFGGIARYYDSLGILVQNNSVPFVNTIARVSRTANGNMAEYKLPQQMPGYLGAGSEFIPIETVPQYPNHVFKLDQFTADSTLVGYIYGGINSTAASIFFTNTGTESNASSQLFKVYIIKNSLVGIDKLNRQSSGSLHLQVYPNPANSRLNLKFDLVQNREAIITIKDTQNKILESYRLKDLPLGENTFTSNLNLPPGVYFVSIETAQEKVLQKVIIAP